MNVSRRTLLGGVAALPTILSIPEGATAMTEPPRTTIALAPHPDDGVIRLAHYAVRAADRGDRMVLVAATDGEATSVAGQLGITSTRVAEFRRTEQDHAWDWLTDRRGTVVRLREPDGAARADGILAGLRDVLASAVGTPEVYVASWHPDRHGATRPDQHRDHVACVDAARVLQREGVIVRYALHPTSTRRGITYRATTTEQKVRVAAAVTSYAPIGARSTRSLALVTEGTTRVTI